MANLCRDRNIEGSKKMHRKALVACMILALRLLAGCCNSGTSSVRVAAVHGVPRALHDVRVTSENWHYLTPKEVFSDFRSSVFASGITGREGVALVFCHTGSIDDQPVGNTNLPKVFSLLQGLRYLCAQSGMMCRINDKWVLIARRCYDEAFTVNADADATVALLSKLPVKSGIFSNCTMAQFVAALNGDNDTRLRWEELSGGKALVIVYEPSHGSDELKIWLDYEANVPSVAELLRIISMAAPVTCTIEATRVVVQQRPLHGDSSGF